MGAIHLDRAEVAEDAQPYAVSSDSLVETPIGHYESEDRELLLGVYKRLLFQPALAILPRWIKPNSISIFGVFSAVGAVVSALIAISGVPIFYLASAALLYIYLIADNIDGPQARRTGQADELGELIDHGLDGITSGAILVTAGIILHMGAGWFLALSSLGSLAFIIVMWEQYRTGKLIIPKMSGTEGVTLVAGLNVFIFFAGEPQWLSFDVVTLNLAAGVLIFTLCMYILMMIPPVLRVMRAGYSAVELRAPFALVASCGLYVFLGAEGLFPAIVVNIYGALLATRLILYRQSGTPSPLYAPSDLLMLAPLIPAFLLPGLRGPHVWAAAAAIIVSVYFVGTMVSSAITFRRMARAQG